MRISARCDYACKAILELSFHWPSKEPLQIHTIAGRQKIPMKYLVQILIQLKRTGVVVSSRGKGGGYILTRPPDKISLGELIRSIGGPFLSVVQSAAEKESVFAAVWKEVEGAIAKVLDKITFEDIVNKTKQMDKAIIYQI